jgi:hypothetical protein
MRRLIISSLLALAALAGFATAAYAAAPAITSFSPAQVRVGQKLVINGKNFKKGVRNNRVFFIRASDGKTVRTRPSKANSARRIEVIVPAGVTKFLTIKDGVGIATRFRLQLLSGQFSNVTAKSRSPLIVPAGGPGTPTTPGTVVGVTPPPPADCDADGTPDATDADDDNDGLSDDLEARIGTDRCKPDTDGDGVRDAFEYYSALDLNSNNLPYPGKRPYPNALDSADAAKDFDGDGLTSANEFALWSAFGGGVLPAAPGQSFPYSDGNQFSPAPPCPDLASGCPGAIDLNVDGVVSDDEKDADGDALPNYVELAAGDSTVPPTSSIQKPATPCTFTGADNRFTICTRPDDSTVEVPNGNTFKALTQTSIATPAPGFWFQLEMWNADSDGDTITDGGDDQDHDGLSNAQEATATFTNPVDPCDPNPHAPACPQHTTGG